MDKLLISACLLGQKVRYDGQDLFRDHPILAEWQQAGRLIPVCPEVCGGLPTPRPPAEISGGDGAKVLDGNVPVLDSFGQDVTPQFLKGAHYALQLCKQHDIRIAILTERSPSCGSSLAYDGSFSGVRVAGQGVTAALLAKNGVKVFNQHQLEDAAAMLAKLNY